MVRVNVLKFAGAFATVCLKTFFWFLCSTYRLAFSEISLSINEKNQKNKKRAKEQFGEWSDLVQFGR